MDTPNIAAQQAAALEELLMARSYLYELFHKCFGGDPSGELVEAITSRETLEVVAEYAEDDDTMRGFCAFLEGVASEVASSPSGTQGFADKVRGEYTRLFIGPGMPEAMPWETLYLTNEPSYCSENTVAVRRIIKSHGFKLVREGHVADDHISIMMALMAKRSRRATKALREGSAERLSALLRGQQTFVREHMASWIPSCAKRVRASKTATLYPQMLEAAGAFVKIDEIFLGEAAYWAEGQIENGLPSPTESHAHIEAEAALERLKAIRLRGLEDNELAEIVS